MKTSKMFDSIIKEIEHNRMTSEAKISKKKTEIYEKFPRIAEIEQLIAEKSMKAIKLSLSGMEETDPALEMRAEVSSLIEEKKSILSANGLSDDFNDLYTCKHCKDTGFVGNIKCSCIKKRIVEKYLEMSGLKEILKHENFDTFDLSLYSDAIDQKSGVSPLQMMKRTYSICMEFVQKFDTAYENLLLHGTTALGKTFLCNCMAKELLEQGKSVVYVTASQLFKLIEKLRFGDMRDNEASGDYDYYDLVFSADLLIIDDLGTEFMTSVTSSELFNIINTRQLEKRSVIISTNLSLDELKERYSDRIFSRLIGNYTIRRFIGEDIRQKKKFM